MAALPTPRQIANATPILLFLVSLFLVSVNHHPKFSPAEQHVITTGIYSLSSAVLAHNACNLLLWYAASGAAVRAPVYCLAPMAGTAVAVAATHARASGGYGTEEWEFVESLPSLARQSISDHLTLMMNFYGKGMHDENREL